MPPARRRSLSQHLVDVTAEQVVVGLPRTIGRAAELLARLRAALRRAATAGADGGEAVLRTDDFVVDLAAKTVSLADDTDVHLTPTEWGILELLVRHRGKLVAQRELLREVWGPAYQSEINYLRVYLAQLRRKLEPVPSSPKYLITEAGMGYRSEG